MKAVNQKRRRLLIISLILTAIMLIGLLAHSVIFFTLNKYYPSPAISSAYTADGGETAAAIRLFWRSMAENVHNLTLLIFIVGNIVLLCRFHLNGPAVGFFRLILYFAGIVMAMFICTVPFAMADSMFYGDYLFPVWGSLASLGILFLIALVMSVREQIYHHL